MVNREERERIAGLRVGEIAVFDDMRGFARLRAITQTLRMLGFGIYSCATIEKKLVIRRDA